MIVRRGILNRVGLFDSRFFTLLEDVDLGWRIRLAGHKNVFVPNSMVYHKSGYAIKSAPQKNFHASKNRIAMMIKNYSFKNLIRYVSARIIIDISLATRSMLLHKNDIALSIVKAIFWNLKNFRHFWKKRLKVQHILRKVSDEHLMERVIKKPSFPFIFNLLPFRRRRLLKLYKWS